MDDERAPHVRRPLRFRNNWLFGETAGQPLFIVETLKALVDRELLVAEPIPGEA